MPEIIVLMGAQGAGKGTQAHLLTERLKLPLVATGDILREMALSDEPLGLQDASDRLLYLGADRCELGLEIEDRDARHGRMIAKEPPR